MRPGRSRLLRIDVVRSEDAKAPMGTALEIRTDLAGPAELRRLARRERGPPMLGDHHAQRNTAHVLKTRGSSRPGGMAAEHGPYVRNMPASRRCATPSVGSAAWRRRCGRARAAADPVSAASP